MFCNLSGLLPAPIFVAMPWHQATGQVTEVVKMISKLIASLLDRRTV